MSRGKLTLALAAGGAVTTILVALERALRLDALILAGATVVSVLLLAALAAPPDPRDLPLVALRVAGRAAVVVLLLVAASLLAAAALPRSVEAAAPGVRLALAALLGLAGLALWRSVEAARARARGG